MNLAHGIAHIPGLFITKVATHASMPLSARASFARQNPGAAEKQRWPHTTSHECIIAGFSKISQTNIFLSTHILHSALSWHSTATLAREYVFTCGEASRSISDAFLLLPKSSLIRAIEPY